MRQTSMIHLREKSSDEVYVSDQGGNCGSSSNKFKQKHYNCEIGSEEERSKNTLYTPTLGRDNHDYFDIGDSSSSDPNDLQIEEVGPLKQEKTFNISTPTVEGLQKMSKEIEEIKF